MDAESILKGALEGLRNTLPINVELKQGECLVAIRSLQQNGASDVRVTQQFVNLVAATPDRFLQHTDNPDAIRSSSPSEGHHSNNATLSQSHSDRVKDVDDRKHGTLARIEPKRFRAQILGGKTERIMLDGEISSFTPHAQQMLYLAGKEADRLNHNFVGTEHLLLGLIKLDQAVAVNVLHKIGLDLETILMEVEKLVGTGPDQKMIGTVPYTPRVRKVLSFAAKEAQGLGHANVGTVHVLLGLLREGDGVAARVLNGLGVDIKQIRQHFP